MGVIKKINHYAIPPKCTGEMFNTEVDTSNLVPKDWFINYDELELDTLLPSTADGLTCQGGCTDGEYLYRALINNNSDLTTLQKIDINSGEIVLSKRTYSYTHANDMCYCSKDGYLYIAHGSENNTKLSKVNRNTLEQVSDITIGSGIWSIAYNSEDDLFIVGISGGYYFTIYDYNWNLIYRLRPENVPAGYVKQSIHCDTNYIYGVYWDSANKGGIINVITWNGMFAKRYRLNGINEPEFIAVIDDTFYVGVYDGRVNNVKHNSIYKANFNLYEDVESTGSRPTDIEGGINHLERLPDGTAVCIWRGESSTGPFKFFSDKVTLSAFRYLKVVAVGSNQYVTDWFKGGGVRISEVNLPDDTTDTQVYFRELFLRYDSTTNRFNVIHNVVHRYKTNEDGTTTNVKENLLDGNTTLSDFIYVQQIWGIV